MVSLLMVSLFCCCLFSMAFYVSFAPAFGFIHSITFYVNDGRDDSMMFVYYKVSFNHMPKYLHRSRYGNGTGLHAKKDIKKRVQEFLVCPNVTHALILTKCMRNICLQRFDHFAVSLWCPFLLAGASVGHLNFWNHFKTFKNEFTFCCCCCCCVLYGTEWGREICACGDECSDKNQIKIYIYLLRIRDMQNNDAILYGWFGLGYVMFMAIKWRPYWHHYISLLIHYFESRSLRIKMIEIHPILSALVWHRKDRCGFNRNIVIVFFFFFFFLNFHCLRIIFDFTKQFNKF